MKKHSLELKRKRFEKKIKNILFFKIFPILFIFVFFVLFFNSNFLAIKNIDIKVENKKYTNNEEIKKEIELILEKKYYNIFSKYNYIFYPKNEIINYLKNNHKEIKYIEIENGDFLKNIVLKLEEEKSKYIFCQKKDNNCFEVSSKGLIFKKINDNPKTDLILLSKEYKMGDSFFESNNEKEKIFEIINFLKNTKKEKIKYLIKPNDYFYYLELKNNFKIILKSDFNKDDIVLKINKFLSKNKFNNLVYIDLTLKNRINYCQRGEICEKNFNYF